jgi:hypothetical protein
LIEGRLADAATAVQRAQQIFARRADQRGQGETALQQARVALALGDAAAVDKALAAIVPDKLSAEQRAGYLVAAAQRAVLMRDYAAAEAKFDLAAKAAAQAHSGTLTMSVALEQVRLALLRGDLGTAGRRLAAVRKQTTPLGEIPLRLGWLELELAVATRSGNSADASARYREALTLLKTSGRYRDAALIYAYGERVAGRNLADAQAARAAAAAAQAQLLADAPPAARDTLLQWLQRRWREESGSSNGP